MKLIEVESAKEFAKTFLPDIFFQMAVNSVLDAAPEFDLIRCKECKHWADGVAGCTEHAKCAKSAITLWVKMVIAYMEKGKNRE